MRAPVMLAALWLAGSAAAQSTVYVAGEGGAQSSMNEGQAAAFVVEDAKRRGFSGQAIHAKELQLFSIPSWVQSVGIEGDTLEVIHEKGRIVVRLSELPKIEVVTDTVMGIPQFGVPVTASDVVWLIDGGIDSTDRRARAIKLADALHVLRGAGPDQGESDIQFEIMARNYRSADPKPALPEDVRKYQVQAEYAINLKRYADAAAFYGEGIKLAPWWATGRFNRALLLAEAGKYRDAIAEMKKFLVLSPDSPDARAAQDRIYAWEAASQIRR